MTIVQEGRDVDSRGRFRRAARVDESDREFSQLVAAILARFFAQHGRAAPANGELIAVGGRLAELIAERGLPRPLAPDELGQPGGLSDEACAPLVARVLGGERDEVLAAAVKQLVKACFYPEFKVCRDSWREVATNGACRRQELARVRGRVSGTHCVDCPHWTALAPGPHEAMLAGAWLAGAEDFQAHRGEFLPEDFRALRRWLHARARVRRSGAG